MVGYVSNREFFALSCDRGHFFQINRYAQRELSKRFKQEDPIWEKEKIYEQWLDEPVDIRKFEAARLNSNGEALPENYYR